MNYRKLRIAWSAGWGVLCLLLIVLWVRSYWRAISVQKTDMPNVATVIDFDSGAVAFAIFPLPSYATPGYATPWEWNQHPPMNKTLFHWQWTATKLAIQCPIVFIALAFAIAALTPWANYAARFSLRTLLIAATIVAVLLGVAVMVLRGI